MFVWRATHWRGLAYKQTLWYSALGPINIMITVISNLVCLHILVLQKQQWTPPPKLCDYCSFLSGKQLSHCGGGPRGRVGGCKKNKAITAFFPYVASTICLQDIWCGALMMGGFSRLQRKVCGFEWEAWVLLQTVEPNWQVFFSWNTWSLCAYFLFFFSNSFSETWEWYKGELCTVKWYVNCFDNKWILSDIVKNILI